MAKFLIVDDDVVCRRLLAVYLAPFGQCDAVCDGHEAIAAFRLALDNEVPYDMVFLDIQMPGVDGHRVLDAIRDLEYRRGIRGSDGAKVIMTTSLADTKHCLRAFREGCESYVTKPIDRRVLVAQVRSLLKSPPAAAAT